MGRKFLWHITAKINEFFQPQITRVITNQINLLFFTKLSKILKHFRERGGKVCFLAHPVISLLIIACQNYFFQHFRLKKNLSEIYKKTYLPTWNFKVAPHLSPPHLSSHKFRSCFRKILRLKFRKKFDIANSHVLNALEYNLEREMGKKFAYSTLNDVFIGVHEKIAKQK